MSLIRSQQHVMFPQELDMSSIDPQTGLVLNKEELDSVCAYFNRDSDFADSLVEDELFGDITKNEPLNRLRAPNQRISKHDIGSKYSFIKTEDALYAVVVKIGSGSFGATWLAARVAKKNPDTQLFEADTKQEDRYKALKSILLVNTERLDDTKETIGKQNYQEKLNNLPALPRQSLSFFVNEYSALSSLEKSVTSFRRSKIKYQILMEYVPGRSLSYYVDNRIVIPFPLGLEAIGQVAEDLARLHAKSMLHLDVKGDNTRIDISSVGNVAITSSSNKLIDYGFTQIMQGGQVLNDVAVGSPIFMSPNLIDSIYFCRRGPYKYVAADDIYAFAITFMNFLGFDCKRGGYLLDQINKRNIACLKSFDTDFVRKTNVPSLIPDKKTEESIIALGREMVKKDSTITMSQVCKRIKEIEIRVKCSQVFLVNVALLNEEDPSLLNNLRSDREFRHELKKFHRVWLLRTTPDAKDDILLENIKREIERLGLSVSGHSYFHSDLHHLVSHIEKAEINQHISYMYNCFYLSKTPLVKEVSLAQSCSVVIGRDDVEKIMAQQEKKYLIPPQHVETIIKRLEDERDRWVRAHGDANSEVVKRKEIVKRVIGEIRSQSAANTLNYPMLVGKLDEVLKNIGHADWVPYLASWVPGLSWVVPAPNAASNVGAVRNQATAFSAAKPK